MICGVLLAAGLSTRMGEEKLLLPLEGRPVIERSAEAALQVCDRLIVVVKDGIRGRFSLPPGAVEAVNPRPESGQASSIAVAIDWIRRHEADCEGVLFFLADKPRLDAASARAIRARLEGRPGAIVLGRCFGAVCHPVGFGAAWFDELAALEGDEGGRQVIRRHPEAVEHREMPGFCAADIDTCDDYLDMVLGPRSLVAVRGAGDIATGTILRLHRAGFRVFALEQEHPTVIRRTVAFAQAVIEGKAEVEGVCAVRCETMREMAAALERGQVPVMVDPGAAWIAKAHPTAVVDGILAKRNLGTTRDMAPAVVALGPGFVAGVDCDAVVETKRGHDLGRVIYEGSAAPNTGVPGDIGGFTRERVVHAPVAGTVSLVRDIGDRVEKGKVIALIDGEEVKAPISGVLRGMIADGSRVAKGLKMADVDPRDERAYCFSVSDKARSVAGGALEAIMHLLRNEPRGKG